MFLYKTKLNLTIVIRLLELQEKKLERAPTQKEIFIAAHTSKGYGKRTRGEQSEYNIQKLQALVRCYFCMSYYIFQNNMNPFLIRNYMNLTQDIDEGQIETLFGKNTKGRVSNCGASKRVNIDGKGNIDLAAKIDELKRSYEMQLKEREEYYMEERRLATKKFDDLQTQLTMVLGMITASQSAKCGFSQVKYVHIILTKL